MNSIFKRIAYSCCFAFFIILLSYLFGNLVFPFGSSFSPILWTEILLNGEKTNLPDDLMLVNVAFDRELRQYAYPIHVEKNGVDTTVYVEQGNIAVTDRYKLLTFLAKAKQANNYKYIFLDIRFEDGVQEDTVSTSLYKLISSMDRIVVAKHTTISQVSPIIVGKSAFSDAPISRMESNVTRIPLVVNDEPTLPLFAVEELTGEKLNSFGPFYFMNGHLCRRTIFPTFPIRYNVQEFMKNNMGVLPFENLGDITYEEMACPEDNIISNAVNNKYVVIGDFFTDTHDTYIGEQIAGPIILFNIFYNILEHKHYVSFWATIFLFVLYTTISFFVISGKSIFDLQYFKFINSTKLGLFISSFVGLSLIFIMVSIISYVMFDVVYDVFIPSVIFSIMSLWVKYKKY